MARITIVGSGIIGMATAAHLSRNHEVTVVARNLPGDDPSIDWASQWAGAAFLFGGCQSDQEKQMQLDAFAELWRWSTAYPESSIKRVTMDDVYDVDTTEDDIWWKSFVQDFRMLSKEELPKGAKAGCTYTTMTLQPLIFLPWLKRRLQRLGVRFKRANLNALSDARNLVGGDIIINATGFGAQHLQDVLDDGVQLIRGQTMLVKSDIKKLFMRDNGKTYTYAIPHLDGTAIIGGIRQPDQSHPEVDEDICHDIVRRIHENLPDNFPASLAEYQVLRQNVGIRPGRTSGIRLEKQVKDGQNIIHVYGFAGGGYIFSFGAARLVAELVEKILFPSLSAKL